MTTFATKLNPYSLSPDRPVRRLAPTPPERVELHDPAIRVMTDLKRVKLVTIGPDDTIDFALQVMIHAEVRMLAVMDKDDVLLGLITSRDIMGERGVNASQREQLPHNQVMVRHVMTPRRDITVLHMDDVAHAHVRDVIMVLREAGRQHTLVIEQQEGSDDCILRGVFSVTQIGRQLGMEIVAGGAAQTFAELERILYPQLEMS